MRWQQPVTAYRRLQIQQQSPDQCNWHLVARVLPMRVTRATLVRRMHATLAIRALRRKSLSHAIHATHVRQQIHVTRVTLATHVVPLNGYVMHDETAPTIGAVLFSTTRAVHMDLSGVYSLFKANRDRIWQCRELTMRKVTLQDTGVCHVRIRRSTNAKL